MSDEGSSGRREQGRRLLSTRHILIAPLASAPPHRFPLFCSICNIAMADQDWTMYTVLHSEKYRLIWEVYRRCWIGVGTQNRRLGRLLLIARRE
jgi:hypothetical protein